jgi:hypothetical protein
VSDETTYREIRYVDLPEQTRAQADAQHAAMMPLIPDLLT